MVCTMKANGEAAHLSAVKVSGETYVCTGSKNVHLIIRRKGKVHHPYNFAIWSVGISFGCVNIDCEFKII